MFNSNGKKEIGIKLFLFFVFGGGYFFNSIVQGISIEGIINVNSDICVDGMIKGKLFCDVKVIIGFIG